jgi:glycosyltransferase involved in cell wall biosynthesis
VSRRPRVAFVHRDPPSGFLEGDYRLLERHFPVERIHYPERITPGFVRRCFTTARTCDVLYAIFGSEHALVPALAFKAFRKGFVLVPGGYDYANRPERRYGLAANGRGWLPKLLGRLCDVALAVSDQTKQEFCALVPSAAAKARRAYWSLDPDQWAPVGLERDPGTVVTVAYVTEETWWLKGVDRFVALARADRARRYVLAGRISQQVKPLLRSLMPANLTVLADFDHETLRRTLWSAGVYAQLSWHESFGLAMAEAMLCGCRPVITPVPALREVAGDWAVVVEDGDDLAAVERAVSEPVDRTAMREDVVRRFSMAAREQAVVEAVLRAAG